MCEVNNSDNFHWIVDFSLFLELHYATLDDVLYNPIFLPRPMVRYEDAGLVFAECGCLDWIKSCWHDPYMRFTALSYTYYHETGCLLAGFPIEHPDIVKLYPDHLRTSIWKTILDLDASLFKAGYIPKYHSWNFYEEDTIGKFAEIIRAKVDSMNTLPKTRNWAEENWAHQF